MHSWDRSIVVAVARHGWVLTTSILVPFSGAEFRCFGKHLLACCIILVLGIVLAQRECLLTQRRANLGNAVCTANFG